MGRSRQFCASILLTSISRELLLRHPQLLQRRRMRVLQLLTWRHRLQQHQHLLRHLMRPKHRPMVPQHLRIPLRRREVQGTRLADMLLRRRGVWHRLLLLSKIIPALQGMPLSVSDLLTYFDPAAKKYNHRDGQHQLAPRVQHPKHLRRIPRRLILHGWRILITTGSSASCK
jgi:hypothetical protein